MERRRKPARTPTSSLRLTPKHKLGERAEPASHLVYVNRREICEPLLTPSHLFRSAHDEKVAEFLKEFDVRDEEEVLEKLLEAKVNGARDCYGYARAKMMQSVVGVVVVDGVNEVERGGERCNKQGAPG